MRGLIIEYVRRRTARKRGGELTFTPLQEDRMPNEESLDFAELGAEVFIGLLQLDRDSYLNRDPAFIPSLGASTAHFR